MGFQIQEMQLDQLIQGLQKNHRIYAPKRFEGEGMYSDTDNIRYGEIQRASEIVFDEKAEYSFKEILTPVSQTLFFFTENEVKEADFPEKAPVIFLRACDIHALKRLDDMYLHNGPEDYYYHRLREGLKLVLMGCNESFENCFCVSMGTNQAEEYALSIHRQKGQKDQFLLDCKDPEWEKLLQTIGGKTADVTPAYVTENPVQVQIPENLEATVAKAKMWDGYDGRCIDCGRCNFACPTCTCFTMQDLFYTDNGKVGERRRVQASCMVDGFTDVAGGGSYRDKNGERMRFKVLHKVLDYKERNGYHMCVGCGRCDDICPEYISFSACVNKLGEAMKEVQK